MFTIQRIILYVILFSPCISVHSENVTGLYTYQVGAWGDDASRDNLGVYAEIRTNAHPIEANANYSDAFWVGSDLVNGGFIQFGYALLRPGQSCSTIKPFANVNSQICILMFWEYFPNITGTKAIEGNITFLQWTTFDMNGTWHSYEIAPLIDGDSWSFKFDGQVVATANITPVRSVSPVYVAAEQAITQDPERLGPVEFRNMSYLKSDGWHSVQYLTSYAACYKFPTYNSCETPNSYGVEAIGEDHIIAGSGINGPPDGSILWANYESLFGAVLRGTYRGTFGRLATDVSHIGLITILGIITLAVLRLKRKLTEHKSQA